eukprot:963778-Prymnesium_polylepis.1
MHGSHQRALTMNSHVHRSSSSFSSPTDRRWMLTYTLRGTPGRLFRCACGAPSCAASNKKDGLAQVGKSPQAVALLSA